MVRARRAKPRRSRALIAVLVAAVALLVGGTVAVLLFWPNALTAMVRTVSTTSSSTTPSSATDSSPAATPAATPTPSGTSSATPKPTPTAAGSAAVAAMKACQNRVQAADEVLKAARIGVRHWEAHVDAERRQEAGSISVDERQAIFKETRRKGPGDQNRYADALRAYDKVKDASCGKTTGADAKVAATLARCHDRSSAQRHVMKTAAAAMGDWKQHLADMQRSRVQHNSDAQQVWINAYKAAPRNINPYEKALKKFQNAPKC